jgi:hypothetical protein
MHGSLPGVNALIVPEQVRERKSSQKSLRISAECAE